MDRVASAFLTIGADHFKEGGAQRRGEKYRGWRAVSGRRYAARRRSTSTWSDRHQDPHQA